MCLVEAAGLESAGLWFLRPCPAHLRRPRATESPGLWSGLSSLSGSFGLLVLEAEDAARPAWGEADRVTDLHHARGVALEELIEVAHRDVGSLRYRAHLDEPVFP